MDQDSPAALAAIEQIRQLKARYFRLMDGKQWAELEGVFAPDAEFDARTAARDGAGPESEHQMLGDDFHNRGAPTIAAFIRNALETKRSVHHGHMPEIEILSPTEARGVWAMEDRVESFEDGRLTRALHGFGHYWETYERIDGRWYIKTSKLTRQRTDIRTF